MVRKLAERAMKLNFGVDVVLDGMYKNFKSDRKLDLDLENEVKVQLFRNFVQVNLNNV